MQVWWARIVPSWAAIDVARSADEWDLRLVIASATPIWIRVSTVASGEPFAATNANVTVIRAKNDDELWVPRTDSGRVDTAVERIGVMEHGGSTADSLVNVERVQHRVRRSIELSVHHMLGESARNRAYDLVLDEVCGRTCCNSAQRSGCHTPRTHNRYEPTRLVCTHDIFSD